MNKKLIFSLALTLLLTTFTSADIRRQPSGITYASIRLAIEAADQTDSIALDDGTYTGADNKNLDFGGKALTIYSVSSNPAACIIDCQNSGRAFFFHNAETSAATVENITITNGNEYFGGAIECEGASPTINNCILTGNTAVYGGAIDCFGAIPIIKNCTISNNTSIYDGSAIECETDSSPQIKNCLIISNTASGVGSIDCYDSSSPQIKNCTIANNAGHSNYGGVYAVDAISPTRPSSPTIRNSILWNNIDDIFGAGVTSSYSCIKNNDSGTGNIHTDPLFRTGPLGNYYLSQILAGQPSPNSSCLNAGGDTAAAVYNPLASFTTRTDYVPDANQVDMGYHYPATGTFKQYSLITSVVGEPGGHGTITPHYTLPGQLFNTYTQVSLHATPDTDYEVDTWSGTLNTRPTDVNNNVVTVDANKTVTVKFRSKIMYQLNTSVTGGGHGTLTPLSGTQRKDTTVTLTAVPDPTYKVQSWSGTDNDSSTSLTNSVTMTGPRTVSVVFEPNIPVQLMTQVVNWPDGQWHGTISRGGSFQRGTVVPLTATPETNCKVKQWSNNTDNPSSKNLTNTVTMNSSETVTVEFELKPLYTLTVTPPSNGTATVTPAGPYYEGTVVTITANPNSGYKVGSWGGTNNNSSTELTNTVTMTSNITASVQFVVQHKQIEVFGDIYGIQKAIDQASDGDTIQIHPDTYIGTGFNVNKNITIVGDTKHPENVVIDCNGQDRNYGCQPVRGTGFQLNAACTLNGVTIINSHSRSNQCYPISPGPGDVGYPVFDDFIGAIGISGNATVINCIIRNCSIVIDKGQDGYPGGDPNKGQLANGGNGARGGSGGGAGIYVSSGSPVISNVIIENCTVKAGDAGNGAMGYFDIRHPFFAAGAAGNGGYGGSVYGAGIYIASSGSPKLTDVIVNNCTAIAGAGGNGANGISDTNNQYPRNGGDGGPPGKVNGAGIYCASSGAPVFVNCNVENCIGYGKIGGNGGNGGNETHSATNGGLGGLSTLSSYDIKQYSANGGAVFCDTSSGAKFTNCSFTGNRTFGSISGIGGIGIQLVARVQQEPRKNYLIGSFGAGVFCNQSSTQFNNCNFGNNRIAYNHDYNTPRYQNDTGIIIAGLTGYNGEYTGQGGGLFLSSTRNTKINDCNFSQNTAPIGGGIYALNSDLHVVDCNIVNNTAYSGAGILTLGSTAEITKSSIKGNSAGTQLDSIQDTGYALYGTGGGIYALTSMLDINDSVVTGNSAKITGGGICVDGWPTPEPHRPLIKNCLVTGNTAVDSGGGIASIYFADPIIQNCTIVNNTVSDVNGNGGGLFCSYESDTIVKDCILWENNCIYGSQIALSDGGLFTDMPANLTITYSDIDLRSKLGFGSSTPESGGSSNSNITIVNQQTISDTINSSGSANVIVTLVEPSEAQTTDWSSTASISTLQGKIAAQQAQVLPTLNAGEFTLRHKLANVAIFSGSVTSAGLNKLLTNPLVAYVEADKEMCPKLAQGIPLMNALDTRSTFNGQGVSIAVSDTGIDYTHPRLGGGGFPNSKVIGGYDFGDMDADPIPGGTTTASGHGTCCAGIAAGMLGTVGDYIGGVAYNAKLYALKISSNSFDGAFDSDAAAAWDWCISHMNDNPAYPIKVISHSFGGGKYSTAAAAEADRPAFAAVAKRVVEAGITILASSGNDSYTDSLAAPAAFSSVISVGAVYDAAFISQACGVQTQPDKVTCYSNTANILTILAPSENAYTTDIVGINGFSTGDYYPFFNGTSAACPYAAGAVAALQSAAKQLTGAYLTPSQVKTILTMTGTPVTDTKVAITKPRVNLGDAIAMISSFVPVHTERDCTITGLVKDANGDWIVASGSNNITKDPNFVSGYLGSYYLSQIPAGQDINSPCVDAGLGSALSNGLYRHTTRTDHVVDTGVVDMGYHYPLTTDLLGDFNFDGGVDLQDLALLMLYWLNNNCSSSTYWCYGIDINGDGTVNFTDFAIFAENYGRHDTVSPIPNPMTWANVPFPAGAHEVTMKASKAWDMSSGSNVQYYFKCVSGSGGHDRNWSPDPLYTDTGLDKGVLYGYEVKARDAHNNETGLSSPGYAAPEVPDTTPPTPNPMTWETVPNAISSTSINMVATTASDDLSGVEYYFTCTAGGGHDSGWQLGNPSYTDTGLTPSTMYSYKVQAQDTSYNHNKTQFSTVASATTLAPGQVVDHTPPSPDPSVWLSTPDYTSSDGTHWYLNMTAVTTTDANPLNKHIYYYFVCLFGGSSSGPIIDNPTWSLGPFLERGKVTYIVYATDDAGNATGSSPAATYTPPD